mmetsp:Transcript_32351/g.70623  ORF Transcript_32351/g.70623 Transcript_32351/m.70623 type:complete len:201 (+) Transcript_32351:308-910(+)
MKRGRILSDTDEFKDNFRMEKRYLTEVMSNDLAKLNFTAIGEDTDVGKSGREVGGAAGAPPDEGVSVFSRSRSFTMGLPPKPTAPSPLWHYFAPPTRAPQPQSPNPTSLTLTDHITLPRPISTSKLEIKSTGSLAGAPLSRPPSPHHPPSPSDHSPPCCDLRRAAILRSLQQRVDESDNSGSDVEPMLSEELVSPSDWPD